MQGQKDEPAYPIHGALHAYQFSGITIRDYFAAKAMQACPMPQGHMHDAPEIYDRIAEHAYKMADAMMKTRDT